MSSNQMNPSDFQFYYKTDEYNRSAEYLESHNLNGEQVQLLTALFGLNNSKKIKLDTREADGTKKRSLSRTVYQRSIVEMDRDFGLITIVDNYKEAYNDILNKKAFLKNSEGKKYFELPNVSTFYQYFLGGIETMDDIVFQYGTNEDDIFDAVYEYLMEDKNEQIMNEVVEKVKYDN